jgi:hypothetical protein
MYADLRDIWGPRARTGKGLALETLQTQSSTVWAQSQMGPVSVDEVTAQSRTDLVCYECAQPVQYTRAHNRLVNGITYPVRAFFSHVSKPCGGGGEGILHKASKDVRGVAYFDLCRICRDKTYISIWGTRVDGERNLMVDGKTWRPDVSYVDDAANFVSVVEIYDTHKSSPEKRKAYTLAGLAWVEVDATEHLLAGIEGGKKEVRVICSSFDVTNRVCGACIIKEDEKERLASIDRIRLAGEEALEIKMENEKKIAALKMQCFPNSERELVEEFLDWYKEKHKEHPPAALAEKIDDPHCILGFGKYKGLHVRRVFDTDPHYLFWLKQKCNTNLHPLLRAEVEHHIEGLCEYCLEKTGAIETWKTMCRNCYRKKRARISGQDY